MAGYVPTTVTIGFPPAGEQPFVVDLEPVPTIKEDVVVIASTRTSRGLDDQPLRVDVLPREEIEEKMLMTPGDIVMMMNEMGGMRVQATSPSLGAASVRIQGIRGSCLTASRCSAKSVALASFRFPRWIWVRSK